MSPFGPRAGAPPSFLPSLDLIRQCFDSFKPDTAPGVSGWTAPLLGHALGNADVSAFVLLLTRQVAQGVAPGQQLLCASRLTPLLKADGGIRPIAVGELLYRLVTKALVRHYSAPAQLLPFQFGVGSSGGTEPITRALERALAGDLPKAFTHVTSLDFANAFNSLDRRSLAKALSQHAPALYRAGRWAYDVPTPLFVSGADGSVTALESSQGVRQGDPLGPLLFSLGIRNTVEALQAHLGESHTVLAYLDDIYVLSTEAGALESVVGFLDGNEAGLSLNVAKCHESSLESVAANGLEVLGTCIGPPDVRAAFLDRRINEQLPAIDRLADLPPQEALLLLRQCLQANLRHLQRSLRTDDLDSPWLALDNALLERLLLIRGSPRRLASDAGLATLPARLGGMGLLSHAECSPHARAAMAESADLLVNAALAPLDDPDPDAAPVVVSQRARCQAAFATRREALLCALPASSATTILDNSSPVARRWLAVIPFGPALRLSASEVAAGLHVRTLCPGKDDACSLCAQPNDLGHDEVCNARPLWRIARHEQVKALLTKHLKSVAGTTVKLEPFVPGSHLRTDLRIAGTASYNGPLSEFDVSVVAAATLGGRRPPPASPSLSAAASASATSSIPSLDASLPASALAASNLLAPLTLVENEKRSKYLGRTATPFFPLVLSTAGTLSPASVPLFDHWRALMPSYGLFSRLLSLSLLRARARFFAF